MLKENRTLNVEGHYFDDSEDLCESKILEESKLETAVKFKDVSGRNRPVRSGSDELLMFFNQRNVFLAACPGKTLG